METHVEIRKENQNSNCLVYHGNYNDMDFININVIAGELLQRLLDTFYEYHVTPENLNKTIDKGQMVVIKFWKKSRVEMTDYGRKEIK